VVSVRYRDNSISIYFVIDTENEGMFGASRQDVTKYEYPDRLTYTQCSIVYLCYINDSCLIIYIAQL